jgi:hypothetical protein
MGGKLLKFKKVTRYPHKRSEGLTKRGEKRQERLMRGKKKPTLTPQEAYQAAILNL